MLYRVAVLALFAAELPAAYTAAGLVGVLVTIALAALLASLAAII